MSIRIITDSACDIPSDKVLDNIEIMNFHIAVNDKDYEERADFSPQEFYKILDECEGIPATAHITSMAFYEKYKQLTQNGATDIIHVTINRSGSATYDAAVMAKKFYEEENPQGNTNITIIDSGCYSMGYGYPVICAGKMAKEGASPEAVIEYLEGRFAKTEILLATYSLKFMKKSGRISAAAAFAGELMGFRPIVLMKNGSTQVVQKVRGDKLVIPALAQQIKERSSQYQDYLIGYTDDDKREEVIAECTKIMGYPPKETFYLGSAVAVNAGPHSIGLIYIGK